MSTRLLPQLVTGLAAAALLLTACSGDDNEPVGDSSSPDADAGTDDADGVADDPDPVTLQFFNFTAGADHVDKLDAIIADFEADNPHITIETTNASFEDYFTQLQTQVAGNVAPDTFELNYENFVSFASSGALLDLETAAPSVIDPDVYFPRAYDAFTYDGVQYGLPESFSVVVLYYNKRLFDEAGLDYPDETWTWDDQLAAGEALTEGDVWGIYQPVQFFEFYKVLVQNGGQFFNDDLTEATFNSPEGVEAAEWLVNKVGSVMPTTADLGGQGDDQLFASGRIGMWHTGIWMFNALGDMDDEWDIAVEPGNATRASHFFANAAVASATTEHPEEAAAWLQHLASSEVTVQQRLEGEWELPAVFDDSLLAPYLEQSPPANRQAVFDALDEVVVPPVVADQQQLQDIVTLALESAVIGSVSVEDALDDAAAQVTSLLN